MKNTTTMKETTKRKYTLRYYLPDTNKQNIQVCKDMYLKTFGIGEKRIRILTEKKYSKHSFNRLPLEVENGIKEHTSKFPTVPSHYCWKNSKKLYLEKGLNVKKMYNLYLDKENASLVSFSSY